MFTGTIKAIFKSVWKSFEKDIALKNYKNYGQIINLNFPLSYYVGNRIQTYNFRIDGYQYISQIKIGVHVYQLEDELNVYLNGNHLISQGREHCVGDDYDCVVNKTRYYTFNSPNLSSNNLTISAIHHNSTDAGICTGAWISFEIYYK